MIAKSRIYNQIRTLLLIMTVLYAAMYFFWVVPHAFIGLPDFLFGLLLIMVLYSTARYGILPWCCRVSGFHFGWFLMLFVGQLVLISGLVVFFSLATGALEWTSTGWNIVNIWPVLLLFGPPNVLALLIYVWERGLNEWRTKQIINLKLAVVEGERMRADLLAIQKQLNPHFISNMLSTIRALLRRDQRKALLAINRMVSICNFYVRHNTCLAIAWADELKQVHNLVAIYELRYGHGIALQVTEDFAAHEAPMLPIMLLLNLTENALQYGVVNDELHPIRILVSVDSDAIVTISVENIIAKMPLAGIVRLGTGQDRLRQQIQLFDSVSGDVNIQQVGQLYQVRVKFRSFVSRY